MSSTQHAEQGVCEEGEWSIFKGGDPVEKFNLPILFMFLNFVKAFCCMCFKGRKLRNKSNT